MERMTTGRNSKFISRCTHEKVREAGQVLNAVVLVATGFTQEGERQILGVSVYLSKHETHSPRGCFARESFLTRI
jgi:transposase-like protein